MINGKVKQAIKLKFKALDWDDEYSERFLKEKKV